MKLAFSTENIKSESFLELCNKTAEYGFAGFEIFDAAAQKAAHEDSIFRSSMRAGAKRKLINRHINIATLKYPKVISNESFADDIAAYVETAAIVGAPSVTVRLEVSDYDTLKAALAPAVKKAETLGVLILIETVGEYAHTEKVLDVINLFETATIVVSIYIAIMAVYIFATVLVYVSRFGKGRKNMRGYVEHLKNINRMYNREEKLKR